MPTPTTVVLFGATGDLAQRKLLPGLLHLFQSGLLTEIQVVGTSLDEHDRDSFVEFTAKAVAEYGGEGPEPEGWAEFSKRLRWAPGAGGAEALRETVAEAEKEFGDEEPRRLHYLSVPPKAALARSCTCSTTPSSSSARGSSWRSRSAPTWPRRRS